MPQVGELVKARDVGYRHKGRERWTKCPDCGYERWKVYRGPKYREQDDITLCRKCAFKRRGITHRGEKAANWRGGRSHRGSGYIGILMRNHPRAHKSGYVYEHILNWEQAHKQPLPKGWIVHHINAVRDDNRPKNLLGLPKRGHSPSLNAKEIQKRLREVEAELAQQRMEI